MPDWIDWSVLTDPPPEMSDDVRAELAQLSKDVRRGISQSLGTRVLQKVEADTAPWFSKGMHDWASVDVYGATLRDDGALVIHFIADHFNYNYAQSGSDWADHYFYVGEAIVEGGKRTSETFALERHVHLTEYEVEDYSSKDILATIRNEMRAKLRNETPSRVAFDGAVSAVQAASEKRAEKARQAYVEEKRANEAATDASKPMLRCPACSSRDVACEPWFEHYKYVCRGCGHSALFENYPEPTDDSEWWDRRK